MAKKSSAEPTEYEQVLADRREQYAAHVVGMQIDPAIATWADRMAEKHGPTVKVWHNELPWLEALMVVRYGEAADSWPQTTTVKDWGRATEWEEGRIPHAVLSAEKGV